MGAFTVGQYVKAIGGAQVDTDNVRRYVALLSQSGTDAPVATVLENSLGGSVVWSRTGAGNYSAALPAAFDDAKIIAFAENLDSRASGDASEPPRLELQSDTLYMTTLHLGVAIDFNCGYGVGVEIRVYS